MAAKLLKNVSVGSIVKLNESGSPVEFYVAKHDYESGLNGAGRTLVVRASSAGDQQWNTLYTSVDYADCSLDDWFNSDYKSTLDTDIQAAIGTTVFYSRQNSDDTATLSRAVFTPSLVEINGGNLHGKINSSVTVPSEGSILPSSSIIGTIYKCWSRSRLLNYTPPYACGTRSNASSSCVQSQVTSSKGTIPCFTLPEDAVVLDDGTVVIDAFPVISGEDSDLGTFGQTAPSVSYAVTDEDGDYVSVTIKLDGVTVKTHAVTLGESNTWQLTGVDWLKVMNGSHTVTIIADDGYVQTERTYTFTRSMTSMSFTLAEPLPADAMITKAIESIIGVIPANATTKIEVCNNGYDDSPTWQDVTQKVLAGEKFQLTNTTKTAENWGYNVRVTVSRGEATGDIYINSMGGFFE